MPYDLHLIRAGDFVRLDAAGRVDVAASRRILGEIAAAMIRRGLDRAILDVRATENRMTTTEVYSLASTFREAGFRRTDRLAVLHRSNQIANADFFAMCATNRGWNVGSFDSFEEALGWLTTAEPIPPVNPGAAAEPPRADDTS